MYLPRFDRWCPRIVIGERLDAAAPIPGTIQATITRDGYLLCSGYIARDGLLTYFDRDGSWLEYRPRSVLVEAANTWRHTPITDDHPPGMVGAADWTQFARGHFVSDLQVTEPQADGASYLFAPQLLITDLDLVERIRSGKQDQFSVGARVDVRPLENRRHEDGTVADAWQAAMIGNHVAVVVDGRAGPACRPDLSGLTDETAGDSRVIAVPGGSLTDSRSAGDNQEVVKFRKVTKDAAGNPVDMVEVTGPGGEVVTVPAWVAAMLEEHQAMKAAAVAPAAPAPAPAAPAPAAAPPVADAPVPAPAAPAPAAAPAEGDEEEEDKKDAKEEDDEMADKMDSAQVAALVRYRSRLVRLASGAGVSVETLDTADDQTLAREYIAKRCPAMKDRADAATGEALRAMVDFASALPAETPAAAPAETPGGVIVPPAAQPVVRTDAKDIEAEGNFLKSQGYA